MKRILVAYATMAGSTAEVAQIVAEEIKGEDVAVDVLHLDQVLDIASYDGIVVGGPMIVGWHRGALRFLKKNRKLFERIPLALFVTAMSLTRTEDMNINGVPVVVDERLPKSPAEAGRLNFRERYARLSRYLQPIFKAIRPAKPVTIGVFGGRLEYGRLKWWAVIYVMLVIQAPAADRRNWEAIRSWAAGLPEALLG